MEVWDRHSVEELRGRVAGLDKSTAVIFSSMLRDGQGRAGFPGDVLARIAESSRAPVYGLYGTYVGRGAVAGKVVDFAGLGRRAGQQAAALLGPQPASAAGTLSVAASSCVADHRQLQAHGLAASKLPADCELLNAPRNLWTEYRGFVLGAAAVVLLQALTIGALLLQRRQRHMAEAEAAKRRLELGRAMRFAAMGELTASIAHEINQPLGAILSQCRRGRPCCCAPAPPPASSCRRS